MPTEEVVQLRVLFLDDDSIRHEMFMMNHTQPGVEITQSWTAKAAIECLSDMPKFEFVFLDHDLADWHYKGQKYELPGTGMDVVDFMCKSLEKNKWPDAVIVHSWNFHRGLEMETRLKEAGFNVKRSEFDSTRKYFKLP